MRERAKTRKWKQRATASQESREREHDSVRKKRYMQGESGTIQFTWEEIL